MHGAERERGTGHVEVHHDQEQEEHARKARTQEIQSVSQEGDGTRIQLLWALEESEMCVGDLAVLLNMTKSAVSHQLKVLRTAKLVRAKKKGKNVYYALNDHHVKSILEKALEHVCE